jgi:hypothetical protein
MIASETSTTQSVPLVSGESEKVKLREG